jgi:hypothetical protein
MVLRWFVNCLAILYQALLYLSLSLKECPRLLAKSKVIYGHRRVNKSYAGCLRIRYELSRVQCLTKYYDVQNLALQFNGKLWLRG